MRHQLAAKGNVMGTPKTNADKMPLHKVEGIQLVGFSLVERKNVVDYRCLIDQSPENLWAWYNEIKDLPDTAGTFKLSFLENMVKRLIKKRADLKDKNI